MNFVVKIASDYFTFAALNEPDQAAESKDQAYPSMKIDKVDQFGLVTLTFNQTLLIPQNWSRMNGTDLEIRVDSVDEERQALKGFAWAVESFSGRRMTVRLAFEYPEQISRDRMDEGSTSRDTLVVKVINPNRFFSPDSMSSVRNETVVDIELPAQLAMSEEDLIADIKRSAETVKNATTVVIGGSFVINLLIAGSLSLLWGLINSLQLMTHFPLTNVTFPSNAKIYYQIMFEIGSFDLIPTDELEALIDKEVGDADLSSEKFDAEAKLSQSTIDAGYDSANSAESNLLNLIMLSVVIGALVCGLILKVLCCRNARVNRCLQRLKRAIFWNFIIRFTLEAYLEICLSNMIKMYAVGDETWFELATTSYSLLALAIMAVFCVSAPLFLHCKRN